MSARVVRAARGPTLSSPGWIQEGAHRMPCTTQVPDVADRPDQLEVAGGTGRAARS
ncbi:MAG: hypothetical protein HY560_04480, partial [Gemmatimonadetes bacterium]|nr:hypothetical protein [Gemmatimonadota bacterium]